MFSSELQTDAIKRNATKHPRNSQTSSSYRKSTGAAGIRLDSLNASSESSSNDNDYESITDQAIDVSTKVATDLSKSKASTYCNMENISQTPVQGYQDNNDDELLTKTMGVEYQGRNDKKQDNASHLTPKSEVDDSGYLLPNSKGPINATSRSGNKASASEEIHIHHSYLEIKEMLSDVKPGSAGGSISEQFGHCYHEEVSANKLMAPSLSEISPNVSGYSTETNSSSSEGNYPNTSVSDRTVEQGHTKFTRI